MTVRFRAEHRARFCAMFARLRREHGIRSYLAHNMTVTPRNIGEIASVIGDCRAMGFRMFSFQPAAFVGDETRWDENFRSIGADDVWAEIKSGAGTRLPYRAVQLGDERCNRVTWGLYVGDRYVPPWTTRILVTSPPATPSSAPHRRISPSRRARSSLPACCAR